MKEVNAYEGLLGRIFLCRLHAGRIEAPIRIGRRIQGSLPGRNRLSVRRRVLQHTQGPLFFLLYNVSATWARTIIEREISKQITKQHLKGR